VTGSNSVNVFLGLGLPWVIGTAYYKIKGGKLEAPSGALPFSVLVFMVCAVLCLCMLMVKRINGGELGGSDFARRGVSVCCVFLWMAYLILSGLQTTDKIKWNG
jgi:Sodium/calcium exchanger protein